MHVASAFKIPDGNKCKMIFLLLTTTVWPALLPPWKRTTILTLVPNKSTTFPFPSSPHWEPTTTYPDMIYLL